MSDIVLDYTHAPCPAAQLKAAGVVGVCRYVAPADAHWASWKRLTKPELDELRAAGLSVLFNFEQGINNWQGGAGQGTIDGDATGRALDELGVPRSQPVFVSYDTAIATTAANFATVARYHFAFEKAYGGPVDLYGEGALIEVLVGQGLATRGWLSESDSFPGSGSPTKHTVLWQRYGKTVPGVPGAYDVNHIVQADWGQYPRPNAPAPQPKTEDDVVIFPAGVTADTHGRYAALGYDHEHKALVAANGLLFDDTVNPAVWQVVQWPYPNTAGVSSTAKLLVATNGDTDFGISPDGKQAIIFAKGDCGTFAIPFKNVSAPSVPASGASLSDMMQTVASRARISFV